MPGWIAIAEADTDLGAKVAKAEAAGDPSGRIRSCPPLGQLVLAERMGDGRRCSGAAQANDSNGPFLLSSPAVR